MKKHKIKHTDSIFEQSEAVEKKIKKMAKKHLPKDLNFVPEMINTLSHVWDAKGNYVGKLGKKGY